MQEGVREVEVLWRNLESSLASGESSQAGRAAKAHRSVVASSLIHLGGVPSRHDGTAELHKPLGPLVVGVAVVL